MSGNMFFGTYLSHLECYNNRITIASQVAALFAACKYSILPGSAFMTMDTLMAITTEVG